MRHHGAFANVERAVREGCRTIEEIALEVGQTEHQVAAILCWLRKQGRVVKTELRVFARDDGKRYPRAMFEISHGAEDRGRT